MDKEFTTEVTMITHTDQIITITNSTGDVNLSFKEFNGMNETDYLPLDKEDIDCLIRMLETIKGTMKG